MLYDSHDMFWPDGNPAEFFSSQDYFPGAMRKVMQARYTSRISIPDMGEVLLRPDERLAYLRVKDAQRFFRAPVSEFTVEKTGVHGAVHPGHYDRPLTFRDLLWTAGFHASQGRLDVHPAVAGDDGNCSIVSMSQWPNLTRIPRTPNTMRVCALLTRYPTAVALIPRVLSVESEEVCRILSAARSAGILRSGNEYEGPAEKETAAKTAVADRVSAYKMMRTLLEKIRTM